MSKNQEYAERYAEYSIEQMRRYGIPASVTLAQGILESSNGQSRLALNENNHFGIKATPEWIAQGGRYGLYTDDKPNEKFCSYDSVGDSYEHHSRFLKENGRYARCFTLAPDDYKGWTLALEQAGYATGGHYAASLQQIIERNGLQEYDRQVMREMEAQGKQFGVEENPLRESENAKEYSFPVEREEFLFITSPFGMRQDPIDGTKRMHTGIDIRCKSDAVLATEKGGKVIAVNGKGNTPGGKSVTVEYVRENGSKVQCTYMHLGDIAVKVGDTVQAGQRHLGQYGNTNDRGASAFQCQADSRGRHAAGHRSGGVSGRDSAERQHQTTGTAQRERLARQIPGRGKRQGEPAAFSRRMDEEAALLGGQRRGNVGVQRSDRGDGDDRLHLSDAAGGAD
jgi:murein DD-endopeptidase MepM/ murein hydrolase activator NlpD